MNPRLIEQRLIRLAGQGRDAVTGAARAWAGAVQQVAGAVPDPETVVRAYFGVAEEVLRVQRGVALDLLRISRSTQR